MTQKFQYSLYPESQVPDAKRVVADRALQQAATDLAIPKPGLKWFRQTRNGETVLIKSSVILWGFTEIGASPVDWNAYVWESLDLRQLYKTSCHETYHLYLSSPNKADAREETAAEAFAEKTALAHRAQWSGVADRIYGTP